MLLLKIACFGVSSQPGCRQPTSPAASRPVRYTKILLFS
jgi:hypothetical protein